MGVSVTNALSTRLEVEVKRESAVWQLAFLAAEVIRPLRKLGDCLPGNQRHRVRVWPDARYFESRVIPWLSLDLRAKTVLLPTWR